MTDPLSLLMKLVTAFGQSEMPCALEDQGGIVDDVLIGGRLERGVYVSVTEIPNYPSNTLGFYVYTLKTTAGGPGYYDPPETFDTEILLTENIDLAVATAIRTHMNLVEADRLEAEMEIASPEPPDLEAGKETL